MQDDNTMAATLTRVFHRIAASDERFKLVSFLGLVENGIASSENIPVAGTPCYKSSAWPYSDNSVHRHSCHSRSSTPIALPDRPSQSYPLSAHEGPIHQGSASALSSCHCQHP